MKIIRYQETNGSVRYGAQRLDGSPLQIVGDIFGAYEVSKEQAQVKKLLAPIAPVAFFCIGLNYRRHAEEGKAPIPQFPVLFMKSPATRRVGHVACKIPARIHRTCRPGALTGRVLKQEHRRTALQKSLHARSRRNTRLTGKSVTGRC